MRWNHLAGRKKLEMELDGDGVRDSEPDGDGGILPLLWDGGGIIWDGQCGCGGPETSMAGDELEAGTARLAGMVRGDAQYDGDG